VRCESYGSASCLPIGRAPGCHVSCGSYGPRASNIKKCLTDLPVHLGSHVPNARMHVFKSPDVRAIMVLQDV
jgi:hypothetical protein